jgi:cell division protein FtsZ
MRGARGLLISITGGKDLTLYEVDEAATRIREEVDPDANIIVGATFDESLEGIIRVSVVATGVDINVAANAGRPAASRSEAAAASAPSRPPPAALPRLTPAVEARSADRHETRIAELAQRLKADNARIAERTEREHQTLRPAMTPPSQPSPANGGRGGGDQPGPAQLAPAQPPQLRAAIDQAATAAVAAALAPSRGEEITIRPLPPKPSLFAEPEPTPPATEPAMPKAFIPPQPERPQNRAPRMPSFEELPLPAQNEYRARRGQLPEAEHPERRRLTLLQRLAAVGLGRREDETDARPDGRPVEAARAPERTPPRPAARHAEPRGPEPVSEFAKRGTPHGLDMHGRAAPLHPLSEDDQLDIPAFLRRQAN